MSGKNWLERDPKDSPGLQRIREAQQIVAIAKAQEAQRASKAVIVAQEMDQERSKVFEKAAKIDRVLPLLEEIRDFANQTETYPVAAADRTATWPSGDDFFLVNSGGLPEIVKKSGITAKANELVETEVLSSGLPILQNVEVVDLKYGFHGVISGTWHDGHDDVYESGSWEKDVTIEQGIRLRVYRPGGLVELCHQKVNKIPERHWGGRGATFGGYTMIEETWKTLPNDEVSLKRALSEAFHDPVCLGTEPLPLSQEVASQSEPQAGTGITGLVKGFLGLK